MCEESASFSCWDARKNMMSHNLYATLKPGENLPKAIQMKIDPVYCSVSFAMATIDKMF